MRISTNEFYIRQVKAGTNILNNQITKRLVNPPLDETRKEGGREGG
jgi:hypothetical protein